MCRRPRECPNACTVCVPVPPSPIMIVACPRCARNFQMFLIAWHNFRQAPGVRRFVLLLVAANTVINFVHHFNARAAEPRAGPLHQNPRIALCVSLLASCGTVNLSRRGLALRGDRPPPSAEGGGVLGHY